MERDVSSKSESFYYHLNMSDVGLDGIINLIKSMLFVRMSYSWCTQSETQCISRARLTCNAPPLIPNKPEWPRWDER